MLRIDEVLQHQVPLIHRRGHQLRLRLRLRIGVLKRVGLQHPCQDFFNGCAVSDPIGHVEAAVLWHRTVPFSGVGEGQEPTATGIGSRNLAGVLHPAGVLVRNYNNPSRVEVATISFRIKSTRAAEAGDRRDAQIPQLVGAGFALNPGHE